MVAFHHGPAQQNMCSLPVSLTGLSKMKGRPMSNANPVPLSKEEGERARERARHLTQLKKADPDAYIEERVQSERGEAFRQLINAAYGRGKWDNLDPGKRLSALFKLLEYTAGKPRAGQAVGQDETPADDAGIEVS